MKSNVSQHATDTRTNAAGNVGPNSIHLPAVPVLRKALANDKATQLMPEPVVQRLIKVGSNGGRSVIAIATIYFNDVYDTARTVLTEFKDAGTDYADEAAIVAAVNLDARIIAAKAAAAAAAAARAVEIATLADGKKLRQGHIDDGTWAQITPVRRDRAYELTTQIDGVTYKFHVHPPRFEGGDGIPGEIMKAGSMTNTQTSGATITAIFAKHGRPEGW